MRKTLLITRAARGCRSFRLLRPLHLQALKPEAQAVPFKQNERELSWFRPGDTRGDALPAIITPSEAPAATAAAGEVSWKAEDYCSSQILVSGGDPKELGSMYHTMIAWACSNPGDPRQRTGQIGLSFPTGFSTFFRR